MGSMLCRSPLPIAEPRYPGAPDIALDGPNGAAAENMKGAEVGAGCGAVNVEAREADVLPVGCDRAGRRGELQATEAGFGFKKSRSTGSFCNGGNK